MMKRQDKNRALARYFNAGFKNTFSSKNRFASAIRRRSPALLTLLAIGVAMAKLSAAHAEELAFKGRTVVQLELDGITDDLATGGLGAAGIQSGTPPSLADPLIPSAAELRRLAIWSNFRALVDPTDGGGFGTFYGPGVPLEPGMPAPPELISGDEFLVFSDVGVTDNVTMMVQVPDSLDPTRPCIVTGPSSGSRGVYGAIGTSGEWGLKRGCAVAYTDKGTGTGAHNLQEDTVNLMRGERAQADEAGDDSNFTAPVNDVQQAAFNAATPDRFAFKHAHSEDNPERLWGRHVLESIEFALFVLNEAIRPDRFPDAPPFTSQNTLVIASSVSNGGGASVRAAEQDDEGLIDGVAVSEPNVNPVFDDRFVVQQGMDDQVEQHSRSLYDYTTLLNVFQGCANLANPDAPLNLVPDAFEEARCASLREKGLLTADALADQAIEAQQIINDFGILPEQNLVQPSHWFINVPQGIAITYANAYGRFSVLENTCGYSFGATGQAGDPIPLPESSEAILFGTANGIPPTGGVNLINNESAGAPTENRLSTSPSTERQDENLDGALCLRSLQSGDDAVTGAPLRGQDRAKYRRVVQGVEQVRATGDLHGIPVLIATGRSDGILPPNHTSRAYFGLNRLVEGDESNLRYYEVLNAQHLDALNPLPGFDNRFVPLHHYFLQVLNLLWDHLVDDAPLPPSQVVRAVSRGGDPGSAPPITAANLPDIEQSPQPGDLIQFTGAAVVIPE